MHYYRKVQELQYKPISTGMLMIDEKDLLFKNCTVTPTINSINWQMFFHDNSRRHADIEVSLWKQTPLILQLPR